MLTDSSLFLLGLAWYRRKVPRPSACAQCGYPSAKLRSYEWGQKAKRRKTTGTGRMRYLKTVSRRFKNGFRCVSVSISPLSPSSPPSLLPSPSLSPLPFPLPSFLPRSPLSSLSSSLFVPLPSPLFPSPCSIPTADADQTRTGRTPPPRRRSRPPPSKRSAHSHFLRPSMHSSCTPSTPAKKYIHMRMVHAFRPFSSSGSYPSRPRLLCLVLFVSVSVFWVELAGSVNFTPPHSGSVREPNNGSPSRREAPPPSFQLGVHKRCWNIENSFSPTRSHCSILATRSPRGGPARLLLTVFADPPGDGALLRGLPSLRHPERVPPCILDHESQLDDTIMSTTTTTETLTEPSPSSPAIQPSDISSHPNPNPPEAPVRHRLPPQPSQIPIPHRSAPRT
ncbi:hypothetical protein NMY22_g19258 [Coprinellus aureogranulatus]|nr:hypothetical protein NMY22_g19258 [Coprinellus aureogranulatus]